MIQRPRSAPTVPMAIAPVEIRSFDELVARIHEIAVSRPVRIIGIEGFTTAGKTYLGRNLAARLPARLISIDLFLMRRIPSYVADLDLRKLQGEIDATIQSNHSLILEAICLRDVISRISLPAVDLFIYVKRLSSNTGAWHDGYDLEDFDQGQWNVAGLEPHLSDFQYHHRTRPHKRADLVYLRREESLLAGGRTDGSV